MKSFFPLASLAFALLFSGETSAASFITTIPTLPPTTGTQPWADGVYRTADDVHADFPGLTIDEAEHTKFQEEQRQNQGPNEIESFFSTVYAKVNGSPTVNATLTGPVSVITFGKTGNTTGTFNTEMLSMNLSGGGVLLRESPTQASTGQTTITDIGGGLYAIDSFFDIWLEISYDNGLNWSAQLASPTTGQAFTHVELQPVPVPAAAWLFGSGLMGLVAWGKRKNA